MKIGWQIKFKKIKDFLKKLPRSLSEHFLLTVLILFFLSLILSSFIFYNYIILVKKAEPQIIKKPLQFEEKIYQKILEEWREREKRFKEADLKEYPDLFKGLPTSPTEELTP